MTLRSELATLAGRSSYWFLHNFMGGGSSLPGKITTAIDPDVLQEIGKNYEVIIVSGTNGKTLTTALVVQVLKEKYDNIVTNKTGSNMVQGITSTFLEAKRPTRGKKGIAVLEVDEANVKPIVEKIKPKMFVLTNIFRDQLDRYGEIYTTYQKILDGIKLAPDAVVLANGDEPIFHSKELPNPQVYYGFSNEPATGDMKAAPNTDGILCPVCQHLLHYHYIVYANLGDYFCPNCGFQRPDLRFKVTDVSERTPKDSKFAIDGNQYEIGVGGTYNIYNALAAYAVGREVGIQPDQIRHAFDNNQRLFGRQEEINVEGKDVSIILVKNPVGTNQVIDLLATEPDSFSFIGLLNAEYADGIDTSWIWDGEFERLPAMDIKQFETGGKRYKDITFRLKVAGVPDDKHTIQPDLGQVIEDIKHMPTQKVYILATYTAMMEMRARLMKQGYIKGGK
ncbi:Mur ligase family protein [Fructilactobacillus cliffordii]|uniref:Lipid II isoglutaminyl synthase (glutamine-hydrolyzing) subunit MurT n=1 Tax=Fructilactobacillus cliffordii TaxID=2940299 RepID=A0A9Q8ZUW8_9LACO|nr:Mur ligase family protein [Fructilactobacillus cliffordii]USS89850.1 Mur ligase family protein [Fructilactobacillus cliffordii]